MGDQAYTLESLAEEQESLRLERFDYEIAWRLGQMMRTAASERKLKVSVTLAHGADIIFATLLPGATPDNLAWAARKRAVAQRFQRSSLSMRLQAEKTQFDFNERFRLPPADYVASGGGVPLMMQNGTLVGTVGVSGLPDVEDHTLVIDALKRLKNGEMGG
ncbi:heme-degrading domain-containing protein [Devosia sp. SL43]|uniref:heme-degrading domain-containing protein n=1 Tax=Devosia sp. SL43 TaxID=2806348 RepID=UPI001F24F662|nr:heme-degrading domain-containing protein [Devosia sp. SL43]UJW86515.1 heme-degrading domain-containing protein [Devosia sp. SL43]